MYIYIYIHVYTCIYKFNDWVKDGNELVCNQVLVILQGLALVSGGIVVVKPDQQRHFFFGGRTSEIKLVSCIFGCLVWKGRTELLCQLVQQTLRLNN